MFCLGRGRQLGEAQPDLAVEPGLAALLSAMPIT